MKSFPTLYVLLSWTIFTSIQTKQLKRPYSSDPKTFIELVNFVQKAPVWDTTNGMISEQSINTLKKGLQAAHLEASQFNVVIDMASARIPFTGNPEQDKKYAKNYVKQKKELIKGYRALTHPEAKTLPKQQNGMEAPQIDQNEITQFVTQLVEGNENTLKDVFINEPILEQADTSNALGPIVKQIKTTYPAPDAQKAIKPILINILKEKLTGISDMRWDKIEDFLDLNLL